MEKKEQNKTELTPEEMEKVNGGVGDDLPFEIPEELKKMSDGRGSAWWHTDDSYESSEKKKFDAMTRWAENAKP